MNHLQEMTKEALPIVGALFMAGNLVTFALSIVVAILNRDGLVAATGSDTIGARNLGAAMVPLLEVDSGPCAAIMAALAVPITLLVMFFAARWFESRRNSTQNAAPGRSR